MTVTIEEAHAALTAPGQMFEVEELDIRGLRTRVWKHAPPTLRAVLDISRAHGDLTFLVHEDDRLSFSEHFARVATLARWLVDHYGVAKGDRVAIAMRNVPEWSIAFWAAASVGAIVVPLNAWWTGGELAYGLADSGSRVVFVDVERAARLGDHVEDLDLAGVVTVRAEESAGEVVGERFEDVLGTPGSPGSAESLPDVELGPEDDATIFYTSGTTGRPKGALGTHRNICTNLMSLVFGASRAALRAGGTPPAPGTSVQNASLVSVPFFHATGCHSILVANAVFGGKLVMMRRWNPERALELIERERLTQFGGVPAMVWQVLESPDLAKRDISSVQSIGYGGAPAPPELVRRIEELVPGRTPTNGYGLTETSSVTTLNIGVDYLRHPDSVGVPVAVVDVKVVDEQGRELSRGEVGELWVKGPNVVKGYWNRPEDTAATFENGWLRSGDIARIDEEGFVYIVDRSKDMVIRGGENVYCVEVEAVLFEHPAVTDAAVIGVPHPILGEEVGAVVQLRAGHEATADELRTLVAGRLAAFKVPTHIWFRDEPLPRNPAGKVLKRELRDELLGG